LKAVILPPLPHLQVKDAEANALRPYLVQNPAVGGIIPGFSDLQTGCWRQNWKIFWGTKKPPRSPFGFCL